MNLKEEFEIFLASIPTQDLPSAKLPSAGSQTFCLLDSSCNIPMEYKDYWISRKTEKIFMSPIQQKQLVVQSNTEETLKEKWKIQIHINHFELCPGDSFGIYPPNIKITVETLLAYFPEQPHYVVNHLKFRADLQSFPKKVHLKFLGDVCSDVKGKEFFYFLSSSKGTSLYAKLRAEGNLGFLDFIVLFPFNCSLEELLQVVPLMQPRYYSVANAVSQGLVDIFFSVEPFGLTTNWLPQLPIRFQLACVPKEMQLFRFPRILKGPIIMVATGTGIAPCVSFIQSTYPNTQQLIWLFYGCRTENDVVFKKEVGQVNCSFVAYSRTAPFKHVQDYILENAVKLSSLVKQEKEAMIFVCGSPQMTKEVGKIFAEILEDFGEMQQQKRYRVEIY